MKTLAALAATAALALFAAPAAAQDPALPANPQDAADMQCLAFVAVMMGEVDEDLSLRLSSGLFYYLGRLEGRTPGVDWITVAGAYAERASDAQLRSVQQRCGGEMMAKGQELVAKGQAMQNGS
jgi:hypothetical protein